MELYEYLKYWYDMQGTHGINYVILASVVLALALFIYTIVGGLISFVYHQVKSLYALYTRLAPVKDDDLHPFTRGLLNNNTPEQAEIAQYRRSGNKAAVRASVNDIIETLKSVEPNLSVRNALIAQFKRLK